MNCFFSNKYKNRGELFEGLNVWGDPAMREQQGKWPVIFLTFAGIKGGTYAETVETMKIKLTELFSSFPELYVYRGCNDILYLAFAISAGILILRKANNRTSRLMGLAAMILGCGDAFHLVPRVLNYFLNADMTAALGIVSFLRQGA